MESGVIIVEVCESNPMNCSELEELEFTYPGVVLLQTECLSRCGLCEHNAFVYVNGEIVFARDRTTCMARLRERMKVQIDMYSDPSLDEDH